MKKYILIFSVVAIFYSCGNDEKVAEKTVATRAELLNIIKSQEKDLYAAMEIDNVKANIALANYLDFVEAYPNDTLAPVFLFKAAEIATATGQYPQAYEYYEKITKNYPAYKMIQESLYLQAYLLDNFLNNDEKAKSVYEEIIQKYPDSNFAKDSKDAIYNLGKTDEQIIKEFQKKNEGK